VNDSPDSLEVAQAIQRFIAGLRREGVAVSPAETIDAVKAVRSLGLEDREAFRRALRTTLVKHRDLFPIFEARFDSFFASPGGKQRGKGRERGAGVGSAPTGRKGPAQVPADPRRERLERRAGRVLALRRRVEERRGRSGRFQVILPPTGRVVEEFSPRRPAGADPRVEQERHGPRTGAAEIRRLDLLRTITKEEDERIASEIPRLVRRIRLKAGRRKKASMRGRPWPAGAIRKSLSTGGVPFVIPARRRRPRRPRVVVLADVSWSVLRASALFLMMASEFLKQDARTAVHLFVDRCADASRPLERWDRSGTLGFQRFLDGVEGIDPKASSDYGRAFHQAAFSRIGGVRTGRRDTLLVVLGDGRNNGRDPQAWAFEELTRRCRRVIWIDPEPESRWSTGDSDLEAYLPYCDVVCEARDLEGLSRGVAELVRSL